MKGEVALITGASSGVGAELAKLAAADGCDLVLVARSRAPMQTLADELTQRHGISVRVLPKDLSGYRGMTHGQTIVLPGLLNRLVAFSTRLVPRRIVTAIARALHERVA